MSRKGIGRKKENQKSYDRENKIPVIKASICNGEQVAGFKDLKTGHFEEIMLIRGEKDKSDFADQFGISLSEIRKEY